MNVSREQVSVALFNLLQNNQQLQTLCRTITRTPTIWSNAATAQLPYLLLFKGGPDTENYSRAQAVGLTKYSLHYNLWLYLQSDPTGVTVAETTINNISDAIDAAMQTGPAGQLQVGQRQTLGGLVTDAWIDGASEWGREFEDENIVVGWRISAITGA